MAKKQKVCSKQDGVVAIYHVVYGNEVVENAVSDIFSLVREAQEKVPNKKRILCLDIDGHENINSGFDDDMFELQKNFIIGFLMPYISEACMPLGAFINKNQNNDVPRELKIFTSNDKELEKYMAAYKEIAR